MLKCQSEIHTYNGKDLKLKTMITSGVGREGRGKNEDGKGIQESSMEGVIVGQNLKVEEGL